MEFQHFAHPHKLNFKENEDTLVCYGCLDIIYGPAYICKKCVHDPFTMHKSCVELPPQIQKDTFHFGHPLKFNIADLFACDTCGRLSGNYISYKCMCCEFKLDFKCAMTAILNDHQIDMHDELGETTIHHFCHPHQLILCKFSLPITEMGVEILKELWESRKSLKCVACKQKLQVQETLVYICLACRFVIHESCMNEMPRQIERTPFHPHHILLPRSFHTRAQVDCYACRENVEGFSLYCNKCDVNLHASCATYQTRAIKHRSHPHNLLQLGQSLTNWRSICHTCHGEDCSIDSMFSCRECDFNVHSRCIPLELPSSFEHKRHMHPLKLIGQFTEDESGNYYCDMCETERNPELQVYCCEECNYIAHIDCVLSEVLEPTNEMLLDPQRMRDDGNSELANEMIQGDSLHPHPLKLDDDSEKLYVCDGCEELCIGPSHNCKLCSFSLDGRCATLNIETQKVEKTTKTVDHFSHLHQLTRCKINILKMNPVIDEYLCMACRQRLCGIIYVCIYCTDFFVHESCLKDIMIEIQSLFHPQHPLQPIPFVTSSTCDCEVCGETVSGMLFGCIPCKIFMHYSCAKYQFREIKHNCHAHHPLLHLGKGLFGDASPKCNACGEACNNTLFCCFQCEFYIHLECISLPFVIKHKRHLHPVVLTNCVIEDDSGQYYCDICETQRKPDHDIYHCKECNFISHIDCVLSEVEPPDEILECLTPRHRAARSLEHPTPPLRRRR